MRIAHGPSPAKDAELKKGLEKHLRETKQHVSNVEQVFDDLGEPPSAEMCIGFEGLREEHAALVEKASSALIDLVYAGAAARTEHYEIAAYEGLISMARALGERDAVDLLDEPEAGEGGAARGRVGGEASRKEQLQEAGR